MSKLLIFNGGEGEEVFENAGNIDTTKFNTCSHRSENKEDITYKACCGVDVQDTGYVCHKRKIMKINPYTCVNCKFYEKRKEEGHEEGRKENSEEG